MLRDFKFLRRNSGKNEEIENVPLNPRDSLVSHASTDSLTRAPLNTIQDPVTNPKQETEVGSRSKIERTPTKPKAKNSDSPWPLRTPDRYGTGFSSKNRFGWAQKNDSCSTSNESREDSRADVGNFSTQVTRGIGGGNGGLASMTPKSTRTVVKAPCTYSESNSTQSTPTKSVTKPPTSTFRSRIDANGGMRAGNFASLYKGMPSSSAVATVVNTVEVPHFDLKEDPSFWMDHNVQVLIRVRPLNNMEKSTQGYNRCLKQESAQSITWLGQPETRFTFDHVACETVDQEMLFRMACLPMVENCLSGYNSCMFAYGQTGSGKTYTMLGEIEDLEVKPSPHRGMTPRIFEFLFARIQAEEESRRDEKLKYNCKCSFLEIYNEQITDLLDPSSANLLVREDVKKGVYVENLSEYEVQSVRDIIKLLTQGSLNRKVAATNMNRESSRSHSVFTCVIESRWEKDSTANFRFARLNLVDLAGSERQKTSGAEGERLKEAANINKSLSTLGHVIMILVDVAHGRPRHVPYRDSRLTFLLQDSLGGNSKTMIIANVSPSVCCAAETLNTLKFAQRAKLIQNNAVVNEDATGDVIALQHEIQLLKEEISVLKRQNVSRCLSFGSTNIDPLQEQNNPYSDDMYPREKPEVDNLPSYESKGIVRMSTKQLKSLEKTLAGALRREQMAETSIKKLEADIEQLNRLVRQREEDTRSTKMMLRFREDKIQRMESLLHSSMSADSYLVEENRMLSEEIRLLQAKVDKNPEVTRFARENIRLLDQLRRFQEFYEEGERDILLAEVSTLKDQLLQFVVENSDHQSHSNLNAQSQGTACISKENDSLHEELKSTLNELDECRHNLSSCLEENAKLSREIHDLHCMLNNLKSPPSDQGDNVKTMKDSEEVDIDMLEGMDSNQLMDYAEKIIDLQLELDILKVIIKEERSFRGEIEEEARCLNRDLELSKDKLLFVSKQYGDANNELTEVKSVIEALESQQIVSINETEELRKSNSHYRKLLRKQELEIIALKEKLSCKELRDHPPTDNCDNEDSLIQLKLRRMQHSLEKAKKLNMSYQSDLAFQASNEEEMDEVRKQVEAETAEVIVCMQQELCILQKEVQDCQLREIETKKEVMLLETELKELQEKLYLMTEENEKLFGKLEEKDGKLRRLSEEWDLLTCEIEEVLVDGHEALTNASDQVGLISSFFPQKRIWVSEQVGRLIRIISEKELLIEELGRCLEDANNKRQEVECMLKSLRGAAVVINEAHQQECSEKERQNLLLMSQLGAKTSTITELENKINMAECQMNQASVCATVAFVIVSRLSELNTNHTDTLKRKDIQLRESADIIQMKDALIGNQATTIEEAEQRIQSLREEVKELEGTCTELRKKLSEEEKYAHAMEQKLEDIELSDILKTQEKISELKSGVSTLSSYMSMHAEHDKSPKINNTRVCMPGDGCGEGRTNDEMNFDSRHLHLVEDLRTDTSHCSLKAGSSFCSNSCCHAHMDCRKTSGNMCDRDVTIVLLRKEIESALGSLKQVQVEMAKLHNEKEQIEMSEKQSKESLKCLTTQVLNLEAAFSNLEQKFAFKMETTNHKLLEFEQIVKEAGIQWCQTKEFLELEVGDAKLIAAQKAAEASCILAKFEEAQDTMKEADIIINELMIANEMMKLDLQRLKQTEITLVNERDVLISQVEDFQCRNNLKDQQFENLEKQFGSSLLETRDMVVELEGIVAELQATYNENFMAIAHEFYCMKSLLLESRRFLSLEEIWSEIIVKDCAISVLHLCNMGILLETVTGLNAENGLLQRGLCESNSVIVDLREHNFKSRRELEMCRNLKGKLLVDIKNSFDRISRKEDETSELGVKLSTFEKKILDLQLQEELMLQRSNSMGSQLASLMKELDFSNTNVVASLLYQEKLLKDREEVLNSRTESFMVTLYSKDIELLILASNFEEMASHFAAAETRLLNDCAVLEKLQKELILSKVDEELKEQYLAEREVEGALLEAKVNEAQNAVQDLLSKQNESMLKITNLGEVNKSLEQDIQLLKNVTRSNDLLKHELEEVMQTKLELLSQVQELEAGHENLLKDFKMKETELELSAARVSILEQENQKLLKDIFSLETSSCKLQNDIEMKAVEFSRIGCLDEENKSLKIEVQKLKTEKSLVLQDLEEEKSKYKSSLNHINSCDLENRRLQEEINSLESRIASLQTDLDMKNADLDGLQHSQSVIMEDLCSKSCDLQAYVDRVNVLKDENVSLRNELQNLEEGKHEALTISSLNIAKCIDSVKSLDTETGRLFNKLSGDDFMIVHKLFGLMCENVDNISKFTEEVERLECHVKELLSENLTLQGELSRKDDVLEGLLFDLRLLQESASSSKDHKDELKEMVACLEALEDKLALKSSELDEAVAHRQMLEIQLQEKIDMISTLGFDVSTGKESLKLLSSENLGLKAQVEDALAAKSSLEKELMERRKTTENLEAELSEMSDVLCQMNDMIESLRTNLNELASERDHLQEEVLSFKARLEKAEAQSKEIEANALEAQQIAESRKMYAEEREAEVKLLERSVEELECTVNVLENKVDIVKGEAERQRLQREELESELHSVNQQMQHFKSADADMKRQLDEKDKDLQKSWKHIELLERDIADKGAEVALLKAHISELNLHAEAQANEYKQKFKALESMAEQVKPEGHFSNVPNSSSIKSEKNAAKSRGSGSPFKCIGLGLAQQIKSEKDEDLAAARQRIEELECLAINRQKEIFALNARLAAAESMTHDVIRDLLGVKLDMTNYVSLLDNQQVQTIAEKARLNNSGPQVKDQEVNKLQQQLNEFIEERKGWLEEIDRKQAEMVAAQIALEKLHQRDQLLKTENEMLKMENINHKNKISELEGEVKKLSGQQNLQQRIHHHAKIKEENNKLKAQNEDLSIKLRRTEVILSRVKEELALYRASIGKRPHINFDEEQRLNSKLKETEDDRVQLAQKLLGLCTSVLKAAGITKPVSAVNPAAAEEALEHLKNKVASLERELQNLKLKNRISSERSRLSDLVPQSSPINSRTDENCQTPRRVSPARFLSALDR